MSTVVVVALFLVLLAASILLWALFLRLGLAWAKAKDVTGRKITLAVVLVVVLQLAFAAVSYFVSPITVVPVLVVEIAGILATVLIPWLVIRWVFKASFLRAVQAWVPTLLTPVVTFAFVFLVFRPLLIEAFVSPTNAMAPTLLGNHWQGTCVECGNPAFCSPIPSQYALQEAAPLMICRDNFHVTQPTDCGDRVFSPDRFLVAKYLRPQRWDLVVFRYPEDPSVLYVMRLVGLPGEEITIQDGRVCANGEMLTPPDPLRGIEYVTEMEDLPWDLWGTSDRPAKLAKDEYFVLGDFSPQSKDSRLWQRGAPGHRPFAVPESHLYGVVTHTYWPPGRWRAFR